MEGHLEEESHPGDEEIPEEEHSASENSLKKSLERKKKSVYLGKPQ